VPAAQVAPGAPPFERKILRPDEALRWAAGAPRPLVFTNGVFDVLHRGHVTYLARARALGASLLVALNGDASARRLGKGPGRPVNGLADRMAVVAALASVDAVTWFDEDTPARLIEACRPEVLVKGGDWPVERIVGAAGVLARGGAVHAIPFEHQRSTTALLARAAALATGAARRSGRPGSGRARKARAAQSRALRTAPGRRSSSARSPGVARRGPRRARRR
jgi:rfaE bifunctional protein nucleotidyltransferase chain/domain